MLTTWLLLGFVGWSIMTILRLFKFFKYKRVNKDDSLAHWAKGFIFALVIGPLSILFAIVLVYRKLYDKTPSQ